MTAYVYFSKLWHEGEDRFSDPPPVPLDPQPDWEPPKYRPGWTVQYRTATGKKHVGRIRFALRHKADGVTFYRVIRTKNEEPEIALDSTILQRITEDQV